MMLVHAFKTTCIFNMCTIGCDVCKICWYDGIWDAVTKRGFVPAALQEAQTVRQIVTQGFK